MWAPRVEDGTVTIHKAWACMKSEAKVSCSAPLAPGFAGPTPWMGVGVGCRKSWYWGFAKKVFRGERVGRWGGGAGPLKIRSLTS